MQIEHIAGIGLPPGGAFEKEGEGAVGHRMLGEVIVNDEDISAFTHKVLSHGGAGIGSDVLKGGGLAGSSGDDDGVVHGAVLLQDILDAGHGRCFLTDGHIDTDDILVLLV